MAWRPAPARTALAWLLALVFLATGLGKALDLAGFARVLAEYRLLPDALLWPAGLGLTVAELAIAVLLILPRWRRVGAAAAIALSLTQAAALGLTLARGIPLANCGCFGVFLARPLALWSPAEDLLLAGLALLLLGGRAARPAGAAAPA